MNRLSTEERAKILSCLVEGNSMRATSRMCGVSINTVTKLLVDVGEACSEYQRKTLRNLECKRIQCDEIWSFCYAKPRNLPPGKRGLFAYGDIWTFTAICADTKLAVSWLCGKREARYAQRFMVDIASRLKNRVQLTTDGYRPYLNAVDYAFAGEIDYAMLVKMYGPDFQDAAPGPERKYSPGKCCGSIKGAVCGNPNEEKISTSYVERQNLTMRMSMRRFTRLTNAFSKKLTNLEAAVALHFMYYNFGRIHKTLRVTPAMEANVSDHVLSLEEIAALASN